ncbi:methyl-accepting chemotaxis sensory transducer with Pas/Pac sensor [Nitrosomonas marina]|uniref:Methyl-accepting chemotaxis sensory transducer with Pas/Pac sensor n=1 Tax=Nitrosomonas marina TaxID=917 RepID=A0A1H9Y1U2_9PROT|nr:PAS domain-containing methyl-accepting chemotaxis protein [Nitrosomonas marina]SES62681.1 methyl-accepting chemotaxis sensory transducer with Pas/Pac sensor [Nitrosomonas marina]
MRVNLPITTVEKDFRELDGLISKTDVKGRITFVNDAFVQVSGFSREELLGKPHNIVRHPDVPEEAFKDLWNTVKSGKPWTAIVKNRCKNGDYYWVEANVTPLREGNQITGYVSIRNKPTDEQIESAKTLYKQIKDGKVILKEGKTVKKGFAEILSKLTSPSLKVKLGLAFAFPTFAFLLAGVTALNGFATQQPTAFLTVMGCVFLVSVLLSCYTIVSIVKPLENISNAISRAASGDFSHTEYPSSKGELGRLLELLSTMSRNLRRIVLNVYSSTNIVSQSSESLVQGNDELNRRTLNQSANLEKTAASMEELTSTVKQNTENVQEVNRLGIQARTVASKGGEIVNDVVHTMNSIHESSKKVVNIISVIDEIAFQTNILALNAGVEAARAGEHGRGFAVVASEVRMLAQRSATAAKEIATLINNSVNQIETGTELVGKAGQTMNEVVNSIQKVTEIMADLANASHEQNSGIEQINEALISLDTVTQQNTSLGHEIAKLAKSLQEQTDNLAQAIAVLKLDAIEHNETEFDRRNNSRLAWKTSPQNNIDRRSGKRPANIHRIHGRKTSATG